MTLTCHMGKKLAQLRISKSSLKKNIYYITNFEVYASPQWPWAVLEITDNTNKSFQLQLGTKYKHHISNPWKILEAVEVMHKSESSLALLED